MKLKELASVALVDFASEKDAVFEIQSKAELKSAKSIFDLCVSNDWFISELTPVETKLEDVFREVTTNSLLKSQIMRSIWTVANRELKSFFDSLLAYIMIVAFLGFSGFFTWIKGSDVFFVN